MADQGNTWREYRKGNWSEQETMVLIAAKKMDEERRMKRPSTSSCGEQSDQGGKSCRPAELRWKWVEEYCWSNGCLRSQNQCNDKWDNLTRDYKKVRDYERRLVDQRGGDGERSYWKLERHQRKERNLPTNMLPQIYEALVEIVERRSGSTSVERLSSGGGGGGGSTFMSYALEMPMGGGAQSSLPALLQQHSSIPTSNPPPLSLPLPHSSHTQILLTLVSSDSVDWFDSICFVLEMCGSSDSDTSECSDSPAKRRKRGGEGTSSSPRRHSLNEDHGVGSAISNSASIIADALQACEEKEERRHREFLCIQERKLKMMESKVEIDKEAITGLVHAINNLANSILALVSDKASSTGPK